MIGQTTNAGNVMEQAFLTEKGELLTAAKKPPADPLRVLSSPLVLDERCTLRSFFSLLRRYPVLSDMSDFLPGALEDAAKCPAFGCLADDIAFLVLGKTFELIGFPGEPRAELYLWLRGLAPAAAGQNALSSTAHHPPMPTLMEADKEIRFVPLQLLLDIPLVLGGMKHVLLGDMNRSLFCNTQFTLFEIIDGLAWELGFQGGSQQCNAVR